MHTFLAAKLPVRPVEAPTLLTIGTIIVVLILAALLLYSVINVKKRWPLLLLIILGVAAWSIAVFNSPPATGRTTWTSRKGGFGVTAQMKLPMPIYSFRNYPKRTWR